MIKEATQERSIRTREQIEQAALKAFAELGYDGASTRLIADSAGVKQQLISYHYGSKLELWKIVADRLFNEYREHLINRLNGLEGVDDLTIARLLIRDYLEYCAEHPELARFMIHEGGSLTPRLTWLFERHTGSLMQQMQDRILRARQLTGAPKANGTQLMYILIGSSAMYSQHAEYELISGEQPNSKKNISSHSDLVCSLLLGL